MLAAGHGCQKPEIFAQLWIKISLFYYNQIAFFRFLVNLENVNHPLRVRQLFENKASLYKAKRIT